MNVSGSFSLREFAGMHVVHVALLTRKVLCGRSRHTHTHTQKKRLKRKLLIRTLAVILVSDFLCGSLYVPCLNVHSFMLRETCIIR